MADFVFATCLPGVEPAVKLEVLRARPELHLAYSRPGLVTFKSARPVQPDDAPASVFARVWGRSIGQIRDPAAAADQIAALGATRVHVFAREPEVAGEAGPEVRMNLAPWQALGPGGPAGPGELVADVIVAPAPEEPAWLGVHRHDRLRSPHAGGAIPVEVPGDAPSRAYAKIEEAIAWAALPVAAGHVALEIGAAPGGAVLALARRGLEVWGVDTADLAPDEAGRALAALDAPEVAALEGAAGPGTFGTKLSSALSGAKVDT